MTHGILPYHPQCNYAAENTVKTVKNAFGRKLPENLKFNLVLNSFFVNFKNIKYCTIGVSSHTLMLGKNLKQIKPLVSSRVKEAQKRQVQNFRRSIALILY